MGCYNTYGKIICCDTDENIVLYDKINKKVYVFLCKVVIKTVRSKLKLKWLHNFYKILQYHLIKIGLSIFELFHVWTDTLTSKKDRDQF